MSQVRDPLNMYRKAQKRFVFCIIHCYSNVLTLRNKVDNVSCYIYANVYKTTFNISLLLLHTYKPYGKHKFNKISDCSDTSRLGVYNFISLFIGL